MLRKLSLLLLYPLWLSSIILFSPLAKAAIITKGYQGITIDFIYDYQCPYCHAMYPQIISLAEAGYTVRWMPLAMIHPPFSLEEAASAIAATRCVAGFNHYQLAAMNGSVLSAAAINELNQYIAATCTSFTVNQHARWVKAALDENTQVFAENKGKGVPLTIIYEDAHPDNKIILQGLQSTDTLQEAIHALHSAL